MATKILIGLILMATLNSSHFTVEKLTTAEFNDLNAAQVKLEAAQREFDAIEVRVKQAHGQPKPTNWSTTSCIQGSITVEIRGEYALITRETHNVCDAVMP